MKKKTNKILLIAALVVVVLNLAIIGTGIALAARNSEPFHSVPPRLSPQRGDSRLRNPAVP